MLIGNLSGTVSFMPSAVRPELMPLQFPDRYEVACGARRGVAGMVPQVMTWKVTHPETGTAIIDLGNGYELAMARMDASLMLRNRMNGEAQWLWGGQSDNQVAGLSDQIRGRTYCLPDGTKITLSFKAGADTVCLQQVNITCGERAVQIRGLETTVADTLEIEQSEIGGRLLDWAIDDGELYRQCGEHGNWCRAGEVTPDDLPVQDAALSSLNGLFSQMLGAFLLTGLFVQKQDDGNGVATPTTPAQTSDGNHPVAINDKVTANIPKASDVPKRQEIGGAKGVQIQGGNADAVLMFAGVPGSVDAEALRAQLSQEEQEQLEVPESAMRTIDPAPLLGEFGRQAIQTMPGQGVRASQIEAVVYQSEVELSWSGVYRLQENVVLLLDDGWAYLNLGLPPADFNVTASRQLEPRLWMQWRRQDDVYQLLDVESDQWVDIEGSIVNPTENDLLLECQVSRSSVSGFPLMGMVTTSSSGFVFFENGRFEASSSSLSTAEGLGSFQTVYSRRDGEGSSSSFAGNFDGTAGELPDVVAAGHSESFDEGADWRGNYYIKDNVIEFHYD
ncbi:DUF1521 domain-containing protein, partial [Thiolapillus sp.]